jgi:hypothetical protein
MTGANPMRLPRLVTAAVVAVVALGLAGCDPVETGSHSQTKSQSKSKSKSKSQSTSQVRIQTSSKNVCWKGKVDGSSRSGCGSKTINVRVDDNGVQIRIQKTKGNGKLVVVLVVRGQTVDHAQVTGSSGVVSVSYASG